MTLVCIAGMVPRTAWLDDAIALHGAVLADPGFYVRHRQPRPEPVARPAGRRLLPRPHGLAGRRQSTHRPFITRAIDTQGVSEEQATKYDRYDYDRFMLAARPPAGLRAAGAERASTGSQRIPDFLAQATRPDGHYETIGDSDDRSWPAIGGTAEEYTASLGTRGTPPATTIAVFRRGYAFGRTGWGWRRPGVRGRDLLLAPVRARASSITGTTTAVR